MEKQIGSKACLLAAPEELFDHSPHFINGFQRKSMKRSWGTACIQTYKTKDCRLSLIFLQSSKRVTLIRKIFKPRIELLVPVTASYSFSRNQQLHCYNQFQYNLWYTLPGGELIELQSGMRYAIFNISIASSFFRELMAPFEAFQPFLQEVNGNQAARLHQHPFFLNPQMLGILHEIGQQELPNELLGQFLEIKVKELLVWLLIRASEQKTALSAFTQKEELIAQKARELIHQDFEKFYTIRQLARMIGTNENQLKTAFKRLHGTTLFHYSLQARMQYAKELLRHTEYTLQHVALAVGYPDASNFSIAFKRQYGYAPGYIKKKGSSLFQQR